MATMRYFQGGISMRRPLALAPEPLPVEGDADAVRERLDAARRELLAEIDEHRPRLVRHVTLSFDRLGLAEKAALDGGEEIATARRQLEDEAARLEEALAAFEVRASARLETALGALERDDLAGAVRNVDRARVRVREVRAEWPHLVAAVRESDALALHAHSLSALLDEGEGPAAEARADEHATALRDRLVSIRGSLASVSHDEAGTAADAFLPDEPPEEITPDDLPDLLGDYDVLAHELPVVHAMALALLTAVAEAVEEALGLPPLPDPAEA